MGPYPPVTIVSPLLIEYSIGNPDKALIEPLKLGLSIANLLAISALNPRNFEKVDEE